ncbi:hypothetical protein DSOUD_1603 [Desulfuromonas soudanensis]|uniref:Uncharacterized protein n=1 Tax=Desulfuromonas soudanensis TaxID=1603606 RepID=A0A0M5ITT8_9BACT|nr:hypothetical protein [Desulfuromonas soudanensis]ALC16381.1 hypothetical protein DSOUD_1603 [Desulfuromonas soudanensis]
MFDKNDDDWLAIRELFLKKRRYFLLSSLVVLFVELSQVRIEKVNIFGNELIIDNPNMITFWLWGMFFYFGIMYFYYFKIVKKSSEFEYCYSEYKRILFKNLVDESFIANQETLCRDYFKADRGTNYIIEDSRVIKSGGRKIEVRFKRNLVLSQEPGHAFHQNIYPDDLIVDVPIMSHLKSLLISNIKASLHTKYFFESYLPYAMGLVVIIIKFVNIFSPYGVKMMQHL